MLCSPSPSRGSRSVPVGLVRWVGRWYWVSTGGPGEEGGTGYSVEMMSSRACSGTERTPERCFGNSGENWSAEKNKTETVVRESRTVERGQGPLTAEQTSSSVHQEAPATFRSCSLLRHNHPGRRGLWLGSGEGEPHR